MAMGTGMCLSAVAQREVDFNTCWRFSLEHHEDAWKPVYDDFPIIERLLD